MSTLRACAHEATGQQDHGRKQHALDMTPQPRSVHGLILTEFANYRYTPLAAAFRSRKASGTAARISAPVRANAAG